MTSPAHGSITVLDNGEFAYYPNKGFKGTDTFTYAISEYFDWANPTTVTVNVK
ncbi:MAG: cadherin-like domain-containing protein [Clostridiales bacterium]|nr:cadherin-like domain-containing protein [Candidatus Coliplasma equi]